METLRIEGKTLFYSINEIISSHKIVLKHIKICPIIFSHKTMLIKKA